MDRAREGAGWSSCRAWILAAAWLLSPLWANAATEAQRVDINAATAEELAEALPGIGAVKAERIVSFRRDHGEFGSVDRLLDVKGIGPRTLEKLRPHISLGASADARAAAREQATTRAVRRIVAEATRPHSP